MRHAGRAAHQHHALDVGRLQLGIAQRLARGLQRLGHQVLRHRRKALGADRQVHPASVRQARLDRGLALAGQELLGGARPGRQQALVLGRQQRQVALLQDPAVQPVIKVIAAQRRVAAGGEHLEHTLPEPQHRHVEGAAAQVVHRVDALGFVVQSIGQRRRGGLVEQAQHVEPGQTRRVARGLALCVVEVGRHGDDGTHQRPAERGLGAHAQHLEDLRRHLHRALDAGHGAQLQHARRIDEVVRQVLRVRDVLHAPAHEPLDRGNGVARIARLLRLRAVAHLDPGTAIAHHRGQQRPPLRVGQHLGQAMAHGGHQRVGRAQVDAHRQTVLVGRRRHAGLGNLQQRHQVAPRWAMVASSPLNFEVNISWRTRAAAPG